MWHPKSKNYQWVLINCECPFVALVDVKAVTIKCNKGFLWDFWKAADSDIGLNKNYFHNESGHRIRDYQEDEKNQETMTHSASGPHQAYAAHDLLPHILLEK